MRKKLLMLGVTQTFCSISSTMVLFAVMMRTYGDSKSVLDLAWIYIATSIPVLIVSPFCGHWVDRFSKKTNLFIADFISSLAVYVLFLVSDLGSHTAVLFAIVFLIQLGTSYQGLTNQTLIPLVFRKEELPAINGLMQFKKSIQRLVAPTLGSLLYSVMPLNQIVLINISCLILAVTCLALIRIPSLPADQRVSNPGRLSFSLGFRYIFAHKDLSKLSLFFAFLNFIAGIYAVIYTPVLLAFSDQKALGFAISIGSCGMILGSLSCAHVKTMTQSRYQMLLIYAGANGLSQMILASYPNFFVYALGIFLVSLTSCYIAVCNSVLWQSYVPSEIQGRTFGARDMLIMGSLPLGMLFGGVIGDLIKPSYGLGMILILTGLIQVVWVVGFSLRNKLEFSQIYGGIG